jgi:glycosyltransferase involved in cell wall biosynthesis
VTDIAFFIRALKGGGAQRDTIMLANALAARGQSVALLTLVLEGPLRALVSDRVAIVPVGGGKLRAAVSGLRGALIALRPRALVSAEAAPNLVAILAARLVPRSLRPVVVTREVASPSLAEKHDPYWQNRIAYRILRLAYRLADRVVTLTEGARRDLIENFGVPEAKIARMSANAVIADAADSAEPPRERGLIVSVGRLSPEKDHATLIRAFARLARAQVARADIRLEIAGEGPLRALLQRLIEELGLSARVTLTGFVADPLALLRRAELAVCSSRYEGFGNAIVEALACGTPVVATDCPYGPREILADGRYGALVPVGDAAALAEAMAQTLATAPDRAALRGRGRLHTVDRAAEALLGIIESIDRGVGVAAPRPSLNA